MSTVMATGLSPCGASGSCRFGLRGDAFAVGEPLVNLVLEPADGVRTQLNAARELAGPFPAVDGGVVGGDDLSELRASKDPAAP